MNRYENYYQTGIKWLGEIPETWELSRVGKFFTERSEKVDDVSYPPLSVTMFGVVDQLSDVAKTDDGENRKLVKKDDFVINSRSDRKGSSGISPRDGSVSVINIVLKPSGINPKYSQYLFKSYYFKEEFFRNGKGIHWDLWSTRWDQFKNINIPVPSLNEQRIINVYLDKKTNQIDSLIEKIQKKIELLKEQRTSLINQHVTKGINPNVELKDSGIKWIGNIPKHWSLSKIKYIGKVQLSSVDRHEYDYERKVKVCHYTYVYKNDSITKTTELPSGTCSEEEFDKFKLQRGDILITKDSETPSDIGIPTFVSEDLENTVCGYHLAQLRIFSKEVVSEFVYHFIKSKTVRDYFTINSEGITRFGLGKPIIENLFITIPPIHEQIKICEKINIFNSFVKTNIQKRSKKIELLLEYRKSLIASSVLGKIKITEDML